MRDKRRPVGSRFFKELSTNFGLARREPIGVNAQLKIVGNPHQ
jgi:hypothetical protein